MLWNESEAAFSDMFTAGFLSVADLWEIFDSIFIHLYFLQEKIFCKNNFFLNGEEKTLKK